MCFIEYEKQTFKVDVVICNNDADKYIFDICNNNSNIKQTLFGEIEVLIPPIEILYMIKKSHIHRILNLTNNNSQNLEIWERQMEMYLENQCTSLKIRKLER
jgi:restriction endonuclease S subunit